MARSAHDLQADHLSGAGNAAPQGLPEGDAAQVGTGPSRGGAPGAPAVLWQNLAVLQQGIEVIERLGADQDLEPLYALAPAGLVHHGAGSHFRHIHDLYLCFLRDVESGQVDYDRRQRDERFERDPRHALRHLRQTFSNLERLVSSAASGAGPFDLERAIEVKMDVEPHDREPFTHSTPLRELRFLLSHTIHHYALIAMILKVQGFDCGERFGVAPSTLSFWQQSPDCAPQAGSAE